MHGGEGDGNGPRTHAEGDPAPAAQAAGRPSRWLPRQTEEAPTILAVLPWLGVPVLVSATLARLDRPLPGDVLPVVAFLPLVAVAYLVAVRLPVGRRAAAVGLPGVAVLAVLLTFLGRTAGPGAALTFGVALAATFACTAAFVLVANAAWRMPAATVAAGGAMVLAQGLDGFLTYLAVDNPFGWLPTASAERVWVSRAILAAWPAMYPVLKEALAVGLALLLGRRPMPAPQSVGLALVVCYTGLSPAMFSAANLFLAD